MTYQIKGGDSVPAISVFFPKNTSLLLEGVNHEDLLFEQ
jgi:hypothetical protein